jgi:predicted hydrocarbon binding protein
MGAENYNISAAYLRGYLSGLRKISGPQYIRLLEHCGLSKYAEKYPPPSLEIIAKGSTIICLRQAVSDILGNDLFNLFLRNLGREFARNVASYPGLKDKVEKLGPISTRAQLIKLFDLFGEVTSQTAEEQIRHEIAPDADGVYLTYHDCLHCAAQRGKVDSPACIGIVSYQKELLYNLTGQRFQTEEVHCGAMYNEPDCRFLITRSGIAR